MTLTVETQTTTERLEAQALRVLQLKMASDEAKARFEEADREFRRDLEDAGLLNEDTKGFGPVHTTIFPTRRFDAKLAESVVEDLVKRHRITREEANSAYKTVLDAKALQSVVSPADYDKMQKVSGTTVKYSLSAE
jgi:hypothetical protein